MSEPSPSTRAPKDENPVRGVDPGELGAYVSATLGATMGAVDLDALGEIAASTKSRDSYLASHKRGLAQVAAEDRPRMGAELNAAAQVIEKAIAARRDALSAGERSQRLAVDHLDLTEVLDGARPGTLHLVTQVREELEDVFLGMGYEIVDGPEIETEWYNFTALNMPRDHPARSIQDSFYLDLADRETVLLRSQTSPAQIRLLERGELPIYAVSPGRVYRRDTADASHLPVFHQIEGLVVDQGVSFGDLAGTIDVFVRAIFGTEVNSRLRPGYFPFTEPSAEFDITCVICHGEGCQTCARTGWLELGGCGMVHPAVFEAIGVDPEIWTGFAFGFGIDRIAMTRSGIDDIRHLIENDVRFLAQFP